ncbi:site-specific integrase [Colwellia ponticola]|uniref:Site-specific integrase n=1 Tax=Colwellia ponticola TaxID=2304625 RepID=A0A8H2JNY6_9GAMM|nr:site-specific integrase [Colwellia ponticola]TMM47053.1 site-specific integrase [Colwellia ponticola]
MKMLEPIWTTKKLLANAIIKKFMTSLDQESESEAFINIIKAVGFPIELTYICSVLLKLHDVIKTVEEIDWPANIKKSNVALLSALTKIEKSDHFKDTLVKERHTALNPLYGRLEEYPVAALFCQNFGSDIQSNQILLIYLLHFILLQISQHNNWDAIKKTALLTHAANLLRKIVTCNARLEINLSIENVTYKRLTNLLLLLSNERHIDFQEQFLRAWSEFYENQPFVRKAKNTRIAAPTKVQSQTAIPVKHDINPTDQKNGHVKTNITTTRNGTKLKEKRLFVVTEDTVSGDETEIIDLVEVHSPSNIELDHRTKQAAGIYGSRLNLIEKMHLCWRTIALTEYEISALVLYLHLTLKNEEPVAIFASLILLTSKPFTDILAIDIYSKTPDLAKTHHDFIDLTLGTWNRKSIEMPNAFVPAPEQKHLLAAHSEWLSLPLPIELINAIKEQRSKIVIKSVMTVEDMCLHKSEAISSVLARFLKPFWKNSELVNRRITAASIRATLFDKITHKFDGGYAALMLANTEFDTTTSLYYLSAQADKLKNDYAFAVSSFGFTINNGNDFIDVTPLTENNNNVVVGSRLTIDKDKIAKVITAKRAKLLTFVAQNNLPVEQLVEDHNEWVNYTLLTLVAGTGHRSRTEFGFTSSTFDDVNGFVLLSDKINFVDSAVRLIPQCMTIKHQLQAYKNHCAELARAIKPYSIEVATKLAKVATLNLNDEPVFFHISNHVSKGSDLNQLKTFPVGYKDIEYYLAPELNLPLNFLRHYFCSAMREFGEYDAAKFLMGHVDNGEHILSDHSLIALNDRGATGDKIDLVLKEIGIEAIEFSIIKGPAFRLPDQIIEQSYSPSYLKRSESTERSQQLRWVRKLVSPYIKSLHDVKTHEKMVDTLLQAAVSDHESGITLKRRVFLLNRFIDKVANSSRWFSTQSEIELLNVDANLLLNMRQGIQIKNEINKWLLAPKKTSSQKITAIDQLGHIWCSLVINSTMNIPTTIDSLKVITSPPFYENGMAFFEIIDSKTNKVKVIHIDSISLLLIQKYNVEDVEIKSAKGVKNSIYKFVLNKVSKQNILDVHAVKALRNIDTTGEYLRQARSDSTSALTHAYQNGRIQTTNLSKEKLCRWLSPIPLVFKPTILEQPDISLHGTAQLSFEQSTNINENYQASRLLLRMLQTNLNKLKQQGAGCSNTTKIVIETWAKFIDMSGETQVDKLIDGSTQLDQIMILILQWLIDVSKRPGRGGRKRTAASTLKTYMSNVAKPLVEQAVGCSFLNLSSEELGEIYSDALDARNIEDRAHRAESMRNFHNFVMRSYYCAPVDWFDVEPSVGNKNREADANIISMREYNSALKLLINDGHVTTYEQKINQLILILCYRAGLRSGEATHLKIKDIDTINWVIHVRTSYFYRTKTVRSNRRVPVGYFLSDEEKALICEQINLIKSFHPDCENPWFFCDKTSAKCLVPINNHISRVIEALRIATGDNSVKLHHGRHSFANYLLLLMSQIVYTQVMYKELQAWCRTEDIVELSQQVITQLLGTQNAKERFLNAISLLLGHVSPKTTLSSYIHILGLISAAENESLLINTVDKSAITPIVNIERTHFYKILARGNSDRFGFLPLCSYIGKTWQGYQQLACMRKDMGIILTPISTNDTRAIYNQLNNIERIIRLAENGQISTEIAYQLQLDFNFVLSVIKATRKIKLETGYTGTSISSDISNVVFPSCKKKQFTSTKYIKHADFQKLLEKLAKLDAHQRMEISDIFNKSYNSRYGIVIDCSMRDKFKKLLLLIHCSVIDTEKSITVRDQYSKRRGNILTLMQKNDKNKINNDHKILHAIFLLNVLNVAQQQY